MEAAQAEAAEAGLGGLVPVDPEQARRAYQRSARVRSARRELKDAAKRGDVDLLLVLAGNDPKWDTVAAGMKLEDLLLAIPSVGPITVREVLEDVGVSGVVRVGELTYALRARSAERLRLALDGEPVPPDAET